MRLARYFRGTMSAIFASSITFLSYPLLARLYSLESFAILAVVNAFALIISSFISLRFDYFLLSAGSKVGCIRYFVIAGFLTTFISLFFMFFLCFFIFFSIISEKFYLLMPLVVVMSFFNIIVFYYTACRDDEKVAILRVARSFLVAIFQLLFCYFFNVYGLLLGLLFGTFIPVIYVLFKLRFLLYGYISRISFKVGIVNFLMMLLMKRRLDITFQLPQTILNSIQNNSIPIILSVLFGPVIVGSYALIEKIIRMPIGLVLDALRPIMIVEYTKTHAGDRVRDMIFYSMVALILSFVYNSIIYLFEDFIVRFMSLPYGSNILIFPIAAFAYSAAISLPLLCYFQAGSKSMQLFLIELIRFLLVLLMVALMYFNLLKMEVTVYLYVYSLIFVAVPLFVWLFFYDSKNIKALRVGKR